MPSAVSAMHDVGLRLDVRSGPLRIGGMRGSRLRTLSLEGSCDSDVRLLPLEG